MFIQGAGTAERTYDAIVVGSGISGGWAAKELTEKGLRTLVLERGRDVKHPDYPTAMMESWEFAGRNRLSRADIAKQEKQNRTGYTTHPASTHWFVNDVEHPYTEVKRFDWMRGYHVGGRSLLWGRQCYRWSDLDFEANAQDGVGVDWPIRYADIAPWYDYVERFAGVSGSRDGLPQLPDGQFLPPMEMNCLETQVKERIAEGLRRPRDDHRPRREPHASRTTAAAPASTATAASAAARTAPTSAATPRRCRPPTRPAS